MTDIERQKLLLIDRFFFSYTLPNCLSLYKKVPYSWHLLRDDKRTLLHVTMGSMALFFGKLLLAYENYIQTTLLNFACFGATFYGNFSTMMVRILSFLNL